MQSVLRISNAKRLSDTLMSVQATSECKSDNNVEDLCQALE
jgi:hypothetical protein